MSPLAFVLPLTLLPGVALLIVSTAARFGQLRDEIQREMAGEDRRVFALFVRQARHFQRALLSLYLCVMLLTLAALVGVGLQVAGIAADGGIALFTVGGCASLLFSAYHLLRETLLSLHRIQAHLLNMGDPANKQG
jgi:hypothetical protein